MATAPTTYQRRGSWPSGRRREPVSENPYERFHLFWNDDLAGFKPSHMGLDWPEERCIDRTNPIETVEWLLPGWRVLTRLRTEQTVTWADNGDTYWSLAGRKQPRDKKGVREHLLLARTPDQSSQWPLPEHAAGQTTANWMLFSLPTTNVRPYFRAYGHSPITSQHWRNWTPWERLWATSFALRSAVIGQTPLALVNSLCLMHEDPPHPPDRKWWPASDQARTLAAALAGQTGSGTHHSGASRKAALAEHAQPLAAVRSLFALGARPEWHAIVND